MDDVSYPAHLSLFGEHDNDGWVVFPQHPPEVLDRFIERSLSGDVGTPEPVAVDVASVNVVAPVDA